MNELHSPILIFLVAGFASYRIAIAFVVEMGPGDIFEKIRLKAGCYDIGEDGRPETWLGRFFDCTSCLGFWVSIFVAVTMALPVIPHIWAVVAVAGLQHFLTQRFLLLGD